MARLRYNNSVGTLGAALTSGGTTITFASAPSFATITSPDYIPLILEPAGSTPSANFEIVHLTAYTAGATTGTISRGQEGTTGVAHANGVAWAHGPVQMDAYENMAVFTSSGTFNIPANVTQMAAQVVGGGGGGAGGGAASSGNTISGGGGGGAGMIVHQMVTISGDTALTVTVGAGGSGGTGATAGSNGYPGDSASNGGNSTVKGATTNTVYAQADGGQRAYQQTGGNWGGSGGAGGASRNSGGNPAYGTGGYATGSGLGSTPVNGVVGGAAGAASSSSSGGTGGGASVGPSAADPPAGGSAAGTAGGAGTTATTPGCGGGGGGGSAFNSAGGNGGGGAAGQIILFW